MSKAYALKRIDETKNEIECKINEKYPTNLNNPAPMSSKQIIKLFQMGKIQLKPVKEINTYYLSHIFDLPHDKKLKELQDKNYEVKNKLCAEVTKIKDELMLGDLNEAIKLIDRLRKFKI